MNTWLFKSVLIYCIVITSICTKAFGQLGDDVTPDARVISKLKALGIKYEITEKGNFKLVFSLSTGRTQLVIVNSNTYEYGGMEIREIYSTAALTDTKTSFSSSTLFALLEKNNTYKLGAWQINGGKAPFLLQFGLRISANASQDNLKDMLILASKVADEMEQVLTSEDKY